MSKFGEPDDIYGECNARLYIADNFGDNHATMRCQLVPDHDGQHAERYKAGDDPVEVRWSHDERRPEPEEDKHE